MVNEACSDAASGPILNNNPWYPAVPDYVDLAFLTARDASCTTTLFYNDYYYGWEGNSSAKDASRGIYFSLHDVSAEGSEGGSHCIGVDGGHEGDLGERYVITSFMCTVRTHRGPSVSTGEPSNPS